MKNEKIKTLQQYIKDSNRIVFLGGAGVSTASGIPDFRSATGLYVENQLLRPEVIISGDFFYLNTQIFYDFYKKHMIYPNALPNGAHKGLKRLEDLGRLEGIITQNIDGLHQIAGSKNVLEFHGSIHQNYCLACNTFYDLNKILTETVPKCHCGGLIKPFVTLYGENLPQGIIERSIDLIKKADLLIIGGTSLSVYPAASLYEYYDKTKPLVIINKSLTGREIYADLVINEPIEEVFEALDYSLL